MSIYSYDTGDLSYEVMNLSARPTLLCLHGWGTSRYIWKDADHYLQDWRIIKIDLPGMGRSSYQESIGAGGYIAKTTEIIDGFLSHLKIKEISLLGHSIGGIVAAKLQSVSSVPINHLILDSTPLLGGKGLSLKVRLFGMNRMIRTPLYMALKSPKVTRKLIHNTFENIDSVSQDTIEQLISDFGAVDQQVLYQSWKDSVATIAADELRQCHSNVLYITGENNLTLDWKTMVKALMSRVSTAKAVTIPKVRHYPQLERPSEYYGEIKVFLE